MYHIGSLYIGYHVHVGAQGFLYNTQGWNEYKRLRTTDLYKF